MTTITSEPPRTSMSSRNWGNGLAALGLVGLLASLAWWFLTYNAVALGPGGIWSAIPCIFYSTAECAAATTAPTATGIPAYHWGVFWLFVAVGLLGLISSDPRVEPRPIITPLGSFYDWSRDLSYLVVRLTAGGMLLVHGLMKLTTSSVAAFASGSLARRGLEPAVPLAYAVFLLETVGAVCIMLGLFTRFFATAIGIQFLIITFNAHWAQGFVWSRGGWEYPLFWGLIILAIGLRGGGPYSLDRKLGWEL